MMLKRIDNNLITINVLWFVLIFILCATPGQFIPSFSWLDLLSFDKFVHASIFFVLSILFFLNLYKKKKGFQTFILFLMLAIIYGISLEIMQATVFVNRSADWNDIIANTFGCVMAFVFREKINLNYRKRLENLN